MTFELPEPLARISDDDPVEVRNATALRNVASEAGVCQSCGSDVLVLQVPLEGISDEVEVWMVHERGCVATDSHIRQAAG